MNIAQRIVDVESYIDRLPESERHTGPVRLWDWVNTFDHLIEEDEVEWRVLAVNPGKSIHYCYRLINLLGYDLLGWKYNNDGTTLTGVITNVPAMEHSAFWDDDSDSEFEDSDDEEDPTDSWSEECVDCGALLGGKVFHNEDEFDEHPDRDAGYDEDGDWHCAKCRSHN